MGQPIPTRLRSGVVGQTDDDEAQFYSCSDEEVSPARFRYDPYQGPYDDASSYDGRLSGIALDW
ncbi:hypothetical protein D1794_29185 (plasmid) [Streptomyces clavuligerus]|nr:hypothetical protein D1794_29185 [Streptomyces clavuligerus]